MSEKFQLILGDCVDAMRQLPDESVDAVVCDPPYFLEFMGQNWDTPSEVANANRGTLTNMVNEDGSQKFRLKAPAFDATLKSAHAMQEWHFAWAKEALRVLKPGGHLLAFGGTRTFHRLACAIEDAGFELRDSILAWSFGSGFPKSMDVSKQINKSVVPSTSQAIDAARQWQGWGTALKPAFEPVVLARKPISEKTVAANVLKHGTGAINIDACRISTKDDLNGGGYAKNGTERDDGWGMQRGGAGEFKPPEGRWPANFTLVHLEDCQKIGTKKVKNTSGSVAGTEPSHTGDEGTSCYGEYGRVPFQKKGDADGNETVDEWKCAEGCPVKMLDEQSGEVSFNPAGKFAEGQAGGIGGKAAYAGTDRHDRATFGYGDSGGASRFFYTAKASPDEKWFFCRTCNEVGKQAIYRKNPDCPIHGDNPKTKDFGPLFGGKPDTKCACWGNAVDAHKDHDTVIHPTLKPLMICEWLLRLLVPPNGTILDPFAGTGTMGVAALKLGFKYIGVEKDADYFKIASKRIEMEGR